MEKTTNTHESANGVYGVLTAGNYKPILFSTIMIQAILAGKKTQTRRIVKSQPVIDQDSGYKYWDNLMFDIHDDVLETIYMPEHAPYKIGDTLWVRETFQIIGFDDYFNDKPEGFIIYKADGLNSQQLLNSTENPVWKPSIFMPKKACRIFLKVTNIKVERLNDISEDDCKKEGIDFHNHENEDHFLIYSPKDKTRGIFCGPCRVDGTYVSKTSAFLNDKPAWHSYKSLWKSINGEKSWKENPFVWVYEFERTDASFACR